MCPARVTLLVLRHVKDVLVSTVSCTVVLMPPRASALFLYFVPKSSVFVCYAVTGLNPSCFSSFGSKRLPKFISFAAETKDFVLRYRYTRTRRFTDVLRRLCVWSPRYLFSQSCEPCIWYLAAIGQ
jgi:hypothetical protein